MNIIYTIYTPVLLGAGLPVAAFQASDISSSASILNMVRNKFLIHLNKNKVDLRILLTM